MKTIEYKKTPEEPKEPTDTDFINEQIKILKDRIKLAQININSLRKVLKHMLNIKHKLK